MVSAQEELLYQHTGRAPGPDPVIQLTYVCSNDARHQHSTAQLRRDGTERKGLLAEANGTPNGGKSPNGGKAPNGGNSLSSLLIFLGLEYGKDLMYATTGLLDLSKP